MAIAYVGGTSRSSTGTSNYNVSLTSLSGGSGSSPIEGDIVVVVTSAGATSNSNPQVNTAGFTELCDLYSNSTYDTNMAVAWKIMGPTPDTSINVNGGPTTYSACTTVVHVWRGVDPNNPIDVTTTTSTGTGSLNANPPSITPITAGSLILLCGSATSSDTSPSSHSAPSGTTNFVNIKLGVSLAGGGYSMIASYEYWTSGAYDPSAFTNSDSATNGTWAAATVVLRPELSDTYAISGSGTTSSSGTTTSQTSVVPTGVSTSAADGSIVISSTIPIVGNSSTTSSGNLGVTESDNVSLSGGASSTSIGFVTSSVSITLNGSQTSISSGQLVTDYSVGVTGFQITSFASTVEPHTDSTLQLTGLPTSIATSSLSYSDQDNVSISGLASLAQQGNILSSDRTLSLSGIELPSQSGSLAFNNAISIYGNQLAANSGSVSPHTDSNVSIIGQQIQADIGNLEVTESDNVSISGGASIASPGILTTYKTLLLSGAQSQSSTGSLSTNKTIGLTGFQCTSTTGSIQVSTDSNLSLSGIQLPASIGNIAYTEEENAQLLGISSVSYFGTLEPSVTISISGVQSLIQIGDVALSSSYNITGFEVTSNIGTLSVSTDSNLNLLGQNLSLSTNSLGYSEQDNVILSGVSSTSDVGSTSSIITIGLSGVQATISHGNLIANNNIQQIGYEITAFVGDIITTTGIVRELVGASVGTSTGSLGVTESDNPNIAGSGLLADTGYIPSINREVPLSGADSQTFNGILGLNKGFNLSGFEVTGSTGSISTYVTPDIILTGNSISISVGSIGSTADTNNMAGVVSPSEIGSTTPNLIISITGILLSSAEGVIHPDKSFNISGFEITSSTGQVEDSSQSYLPLNGSTATLSEGSIGSYSENNIIVNGHGVISAVGSIGDSVRYISLSGSQSTAELGVAKSTPSIGLYGDLSELSIGGVTPHTSSSISIVGSETILSQGSIGAYSDNYIQLNGYTLLSNIGSIIDVEKVIILDGQNSESVVGYINPNISVSILGNNIYGYTSTNIVIENEVYVFLAPAPTSSSVLLTIAAIRGLDLTKTIKVSEVNRNWMVSGEERNWTIKGFRRNWKIFSGTRKWKIKDDWIK